MGWVKQNPNTEAFLNPKNAKQVIALVALTKEGKYRGLVSKGPKIYHNNPNDVREKLLLPIFDDQELAKEWAEAESQKGNIQLMLH